MSASTLNGQTLTVALESPAAAVFRVIADVERLPRWAAAFCERLGLVGGRWQALTASGDLFVEVESDERTGVVDLRWGDGRECWRTWHLRVLRAPDGRTCVSVILWRAAQGDDVHFEREAAACAAALAGLEEIVRDTLWREVHALAG
jgi:hypothetical protein